MRRLPLLAGLLLAVGCVSPAPRLAPLPDDDPRARRMLADWSRAVADRRGLYANARLAVDGKGRHLARVRVRQDLWLSRPSRLRVEVLSPIRTLLAVLVTDGLQYSVDTADGTREMGSVHDALLWESARLDLSPAEAVDVILGYPGLGEGLEPGAAYAWPDGRLRLHLHEPDGFVAREVEFEPTGRLLRVLERGPESELLQTVVYSDYRPMDRGSFAHLIEIQGRETRAVLALSGVEINPRFEPDTFRVDENLRGDARAQGIAPGASSRVTLRAGGGG